MISQYVLKNKPKLQHRRLKQILKHAWHNGEFYRSVWSSAGVTEADLDVIQLDQLPMISRSTLKSALEDPRKAFGLAYERARWSQTTSGSSGIPVEIRMAVRTRLQMLWYMVAIYLECGMSPRDINVTIKDPIDIERKNYLQSVGLFRHDYYSIYEPISETAEFLSQKYVNIDILKSMPSDLLSLVAHYSRNPAIPVPSIRQIFSDSEHLDLESRELLHNFFQAPVHDFYSSTELGIAAYQTGHGEPYQVSRNSVILEAHAVHGLDDANCLEVIGTNLFNRTTPIIRYQIGDLIYGARLGTKSEVDEFEGVHGKYLDFLMDGVERVVSSHTIKQDLTKKQYLGAFKVVQNLDLSIDIFYEPVLSEWTTGVEEDLIETVKKLFLSPVDIKLVRAENLREKRDVRKFKVVESKAGQIFLTQLNEKNLK